MTGEFRWAEQIVSPLGKRGSAEVTDLAPRRLTLDGARVGLLHNGKPNAEVLLAEIGVSLGRRYRLAGVSVFEKPHFGSPVRTGQAEQVRAICDVVLAGVGD